METSLGSLKITLAFCVFFSMLYIPILWVSAQVAGPNKGNAEVATLDGKVVRAASVGQMFTEDIYFWRCPSSAGDGYDATGSTNSNKGPADQEYLDEAKARINTFLVHRPYLNRADVPAEMVMTSGSRLNLNITPRCARVQVRRIAQARGLIGKQVRATVDKSIEKPFLGLLGTEKVNVLKLNTVSEESNKRMKIEQRSCPNRLGYTAVRINRVGWGVALLQEHKIELNKKYEKFL